MNHRVEMLRAHALRSRRGPDRERERAWQESLARTEGEPAVLREAKAFAHYCRTPGPGHPRGRTDRRLASCVQHDPVQETTPQIFGRQSFASPWPVPEEVQLLFREGLLSGAGNHTTMDYGTILAHWI